MQPPHRKVPSRALNTQPSCCEAAQQAVAKGLYADKLQTPLFTPLSTLTCAAALLKIKETSHATVALWPGHARLAAALARLIAVKRLGAKGVAVTRDADPSGGQAVSQRLQKREYKGQREKRCCFKSGKLKEARSQWRGTAVTNNICF